MTPLELSVCLIARNEEKNLPRALHSLRGVAGEIVICDTGSSDRTPDLAREAGARLIHLPWQDDFSMARNATLAAATRPWVLIMDADEDLVPETVPALARSLSSPAFAQIAHNHLLHPDVHAQPQVLTSIRLVRRDERIRYRGRVHESLSESLLTLGATSWPDSGLHMRHHGYLDADERRRKATRNLHLLEQALAEAPDDLFLRYKLAQTLPPAERPRRKALLQGAAERALALPTAELLTLAFAPPLFARAVHELLAAGDLAPAARLCQKAAERIGGSLWFTAGRALFHAGSLPAAEAALRHYLDRAADAPALLQPDPEASSASARHLLGQIALHQHRHRQADRLFKEALAGATGTTHTAIACDLVRAWLRSGQVEAAVTSLTRLCAACRPADRAAYRETMLLSAEVSAALGDPQGGLPLAQAALDPDMSDDRAAALLATLMLRGRPANLSGALALLPVLPGTRFDTLAVRLLLGKLFGRGRMPREVPQAALMLLSDLERTLDLRAVAPATHAPPPEA